MYRKRVKKSKIKSFDDTLQICYEIVRRELTQRETKRIKKLYYGQRKKIMKGYIDHDIFLNQVVCDDVNDAAKDILESFLGT